MNENITCFADLSLHVPILIFCELQLAGCLGVLWLGPIPIHHNKIMLKYTSRKCGIC